MAKTPKRPTAKQARAEWIKWLEGYGIGKFFDAFLATAQYAESKCVYCGQRIYLDIVEGGGVPDWGAAFEEGKPGLDYGCSNSPDTNEDGTGGHKARNLRG
jgi:hypothetical protein